VAFPISKPAKRATGSVHLICRPLRRLDPTAVDFPGLKTGATDLAPPIAARRPYPPPVILSEAKDLKMRRPSPQARGSWRRPSHS